MNCEPWSPLNPHAPTRPPPARPSLQPPLKATPPTPKGVWGSLVGAQQTCYHHASLVWDKLSYALNFEWLALGRMPSLILFVLLIIGLSLTVGLTGQSVKDGVTLGVEFGGGYQLMWV